MFSAKAFMQRSTGQYGLEAPTAYQLAGSPVPLIHETPVSITGLAYPGIVSSIGMG